MIDLSIESLERRKKFWIKVIIFMCFVIIGGLSPTVIPYIIGEANSNILRYDILVISFYLICSVIVFSIGINAIITENKLSIKYNKYFLDRKTISIDELSKELDIPKNKVVAEIRNMVKNKLDIKKVNEASTVQF